MTMTTDEIIEKIKPVNEKLYKNLRLKNVYGECEYLSRNCIFLGVHTLIEIAKHNSTSYQFEYDLERECVIAFRYRNDSVKTNYYEAIKLSEEKRKKGVL